MRDIISAPSPVNLEAAMTEGILVPLFNEFMPKEWRIQRFVGNAGIVVDTDPDDTTGKLKVLLCGHADKIRMQVRHIAADGKVFINSDSFLPATLVGHKVDCYAEDPQSAPKAVADCFLPNNRGVGGGRTFRRIPGTIEALGAIHFAPAAFRTGDKGVKPDQLFLELGIHGADGKAQVENLGIRPGQALILDRKLERCVGPDTFSGAYLDNGLGCFVVEEVARTLDPKVLDNVRLMYGFAAHEEIGRFGSRVLVEGCKPDVLIAVDVNHDYDAAPIGKEAKNPPLKMGKGFTLCHGAIASPSVNALIERAAGTRGIPMQHDARGRDTGTDAMAAVLAGADCAATSVGFPIRNMHTVSELGHTGDVIACIEALKGMVEDMSAEKIDRDYLKSTHFRLDLAEDLDLLRFS